MATHAMTDKAIVLKPEDDVAIAKASSRRARCWRTRRAHRGAAGHQARPQGRAPRACGAGEPVRRYGQVIGFATAGHRGRRPRAHPQPRHRRAAPGPLRGRRRRAAGRLLSRRTQMRYFDGYKREDGRVGTRNYVAIISGVNCSASVSQFVKDKFRDVQKDYPNIDGVLAITHKSGCGTKLFGEDHMALQRVLAGYAKHPNVAAYILIGLGCEVNQAAVMVDRQKHGGARAIPSASPSSSTSRRRAASARRWSARWPRWPSCCRMANDGAAHEAAGLRDLPGHQLRRLRRQLRHHRQPGARLGGGRARALRRHRRARRDAGDLRRRAPADPARHQRGRGQEAARPLQVVGVVLPRHRGDGQQPRARQQGGRHHHRLREVARRRHQGRHHADDGRLPVRRADHHARLRVHGHARATIPCRSPGSWPAAATSSASPPAAARCSAASRCRRSSSRRTPSCTGTWRRTWTSTAA